METSSTKTATSIISDESEKNTIEPSVTDRYVPHPEFLDDILLPDHLNELTERIAENVHEVWSAGRIAEGWTYGKKRDDALKRTPCLVRYADLPESEKEYDRKTALCTLNFIISLGYSIEKR